METARVKNVGQGIIAIGHNRRLKPGETAEIPRDRLKDVCGEGIAEVGPDGHPVDTHTLTTRKRAAGKAAEPATAKPIK